MKITTSQPELVKGLATAGRALSSRTQLPVLNNFLLETKKTEFIVSATNLETGIRVRIAAKIDKEGAITIPARALTEFVSSIPLGNISLVGEGDNLKVEAAGFKAVFAGINAAEFPVLPTSSGGGGAIDGSVLATIAASVAYAAAVDESRPVLTGVRFETRDRELVVIATDGFRLARKVLPVSVSISDLILPARTIIEAARIAGESGEDRVKLEVVAKNNQVIFNLGVTDLISRILEGNYPAVDKIIPTDSPTQAILDRAEFVNRLRAVSIFSRENNNIVKFKIQNSKFIISAQAAQKGESEVEVEAETTGEGEIAFNYKFVQDTLASLPSERVILAMKDSLSPGVFKPEGDTSLLALVMPVRV